MTAQVEKLKATLAELEQELHSLQAVDDETREMLHQAIGEIQSALRHGQPAIGQPSLVDRLSDAAGQFESSHPTLSGILGRLVDVLGQMGI